MTQASFSREFAAHYPGRRGADLPRNVVGPNTMGEYFLAESSQHMPETDQRRITFRLLRPQERDAEFGRLQAEAFTRLCIAVLFGGRAG